MTCFLLRPRELCCSFLLVPKKILVVMIMSRRSYLNPSVDSSWDRDRWLTHPSSAITRPISLSDYIEHSARWTFPSGTCIPRHRRKSRRSAIGQLVSREHSLRIACSTRLTSNILIPVPRDMPQDQLRAIDTLCQNSNAPQSNAVCISSLTGSPFWVFPTLREHLFVSKQRDPRDQKVMISHVNHPP